jgi:hypothetical protein
MMIALLEMLLMLNSFRRTRSRCIFGWMLSKDTLLSPNDGCYLGSLIEVAKNKALRGSGDDDASSFLFKGPPAIPKLGARLQHHFTPTWLHDIDSLHRSSRQHLQHSGQVLSPVAKPGNEWRTA